MLVPFGGLLNGMFVDGVFDDTMLKVGPADEARDDHGRWMAGENPADHAAFASKFKEHMASTMFAGQRLTSQAVREYMLEHNADVRSAMFDRHALEREVNAIVFADPRHGYKAPPPELEARLEEAKSRLRRVEAAARASIGYGRKFVKAGPADEERDEKGQWTAGAAESYLRSQGHITSIGQLSAKATRHLNRLVSQGIAEKDKDYQFPRQPTKYILKAVAEVAKEDAPLGASWVSDLGASASPRYGVWSWDKKVGKYKPTAAADDLAGLNIAIKPTPGGTTVYPVKRGVAKFDENHDERGRFSTGAGGKVTAADFNNTIAQGAEELAQSLFDDAVWEDYAAALAGNIPTGYIGGRVPNATERASMSAMSARDVAELERRLSAPKKRWSIPLTITKADPDKQQIFGWASVVEKDGKLIVDKQDDVIFPEDLESAAYDFCLNSRNHGDMHDRTGTGRMIESMMFTKEKQAALGIDLGQVGWWIGFKVDDSALWAAHKRGERPEFSIGGSGSRKEIDGISKSGGYLTFDEITYDYGPVAKRGHALFADIIKYNRNHVPSGSPEGGQFGSGDGSASSSVRAEKIKIWIRSWGAKKVTSHAIASLMVGAVMTGAGDFLSAHIEHLLGAITFAGAVGVETLIGTALTSLADGLGINVDKAEALLIHTVDGLSHLKAHAVGKIEKDDVVRTALLKLHDLLMARATPSVLAELEKLRANDKALAAKKSSKT